MLDKTTANLLVNMKYSDKGIEGVIELLDETNDTISTISLNCNDHEWISYIGILDAKFEYIKSLITTKRLQNQREDLKVIGDYLQKLGKEISEHKFGKEEK